MTDIEQKHLERLPKSVKIGGYTYNIGRATTDDPTLGTGNLGVTDFETNRILILEPLIFQSVVNVLWHEITHCVNYVYGVRDNICEEDITTQSSNGWMALRIDNPALDRWINRAIVLMRKPK